MQIEFQLNPSKSARANNQRMEKENLDTHPLHYTTSTAVVGSLTHGIRPHTSMTGECCRAIPCKNLGWTECQPHKSGPFGRASPGQLRLRATVPRHCSTELKRTSFACGRSEAAEAAGGWLHRLRATAPLQCATVDETGAGEAVPNRPKRRSLRLSRLNFEAFYYP